jgi:fructosamine-3-kinase
VREYPEPKQYLMHGDFGTHNFLLEADGTIRVIDPMPMVGDRVYDFYFAVLSNVGIFRNLGEDYLAQFFSDVDLRYRRALMTIALYVRMSRAAYYDNEHLPDYEKLYEEGFER